MPAEKIEKQFVNKQPSKWQIMINIAVDLKNICYKGEKNN